MNDVLAKLYVDIVARGVNKAAADIRSLGGEMSRTKGETDKLAKATGGGGGLFAGLTKGAAVAGAALGAVAGVIALVKQGLSGTVEGDRLGMAFLQIAREVAAVFLPVITAATSILQDLTQAFRAGGLGAQDFLYFLGPAGMLLKVFTDPEMVGGVRRLIGAFGQVMKALAPILEIGTRIGAWLLNAFVVTPLLVFAKGLESVFKIAAALLDLFVRIANVVSRAFGFGDLFKVGANAPNARRVTLNQTGTESAEGTFGRLQEAALRVGVSKPVEEQQLAILVQIDKRVEALVGAINRLAGQADRINPEAVIQGAKENGALGGAVLGSRLGPAGAVAGAVLGHLWGRK